MLSNASEVPQAQVTKKQRRTNHYRVATSSSTTRGYTERPSTTASAKNRNGRPTAGWCVPPGDEYSVLCTLYDIYSCINMLPYITTAVCISSPIPMVLYSPAINALNSSDTIIAEASTTKLSPSMDTNVTELGGTALPVALLLLLSDDGMFGRHLSVVELYSKESRDSTASLLCWSFSHARSNTMLPVPLLSPQLMSSSLTFPVTTESLALTIAKGIMNACAAPRQTRSWQLPTFSAELFPIFYPINFVSNF